MSGLSPADVTEFVRLARILNESPWCSACQASGHPREAHSDPALARVEAHKAASRGDYAGATMWLRVAVNLRKKAAQ